MLKYTRGVVGDTIDAVKRLARGIEITVQIIYIAYLIISISIDFGILPANIVLLTIASLYFIYDISSTREFYTKLQEKMRQTIKLTTKVTKKVMQGIIIIIAIIELATNPFNAIALIMTFLMIVGFVITLIFSIVISMIEERKELLVNAVALDLKPKKVIDVMHKITGHKPTVEEIEEEKIREKLEEICAEQKEKKIRKKQWLKLIKEKMAQKEEEKRQKSEGSAKETKEEPIKTK